MGDSPCQKADSLQLLGAKKLFFKQVLVGYVIDCFDLAIGVPERVGLGFNIYNIAVFIRVLVKTYLRFTFFKRVAHRAFLTFFITPHVALMRNFMAVSSFNVPDRHVHLPAVGLVRRNDPVVPVDYYKAFINSIEYA